MHLSKPLFLSAISFIKEENMISTHYNIKKIGIAVSFLLFLLFTPNLYAQEDSVTVWGNVYEENAEILPDVTIYTLEKQADGTERSIYSGHKSNLEGFFKLTVAKGTTLKFLAVGFTEYTRSIKESGELDVVLADDNAKTVLKELVVTAKKIAKIRPIKSPLVVKGNYVFFAGGMIIPKELYHSNYRYLIQPFVSNRSTGRTSYTRSAVFDGKEYHATQERMYSFDLSKDSLCNVIHVKASPRRETDTIFVRDSFYIDNFNQLYRIDCYQAAENYHRIVSLDTLEISKGIVNPQRFLDYRFSARLYQNENHFPIERPTLQTSKPEEVRITFPIGKATINMNDSINAAELNRIANRLAAIQSNPAASLLDFSIQSTASPDGNYQSNVTLAQKRLINAIAKINDLSKGALNGVKPKHSTKVMAWKDVINLLQKDSLKTEAQELEQALRKYKNPMTAVSRVSCSKLIFEKYLPQLRRVEYQYSYKSFRELSMQEIKEYYKTHKEWLDIPHYFRLYRQEKNDSIAIEIAGEAHKRFPNQVVIACDLSALCSKTGKADSRILAPFVGPKAAAEVNVNQAIALLMTQKYSAADSIAEYVSDNEMELKSIIGLMNGYTTPEMQEIISKSSEHNHVVLLLTLEENEEALKVAEKMKIEKAEDAYLRAVCYNRMKAEANALINLKRAIKMKPGLLEVAKIDADLLNLIPKIEIKK